LPELPRELEDEALARTDEALVHRLGGEDAVDPAGLDVVWHPRRRDLDDPDIVHRVDAVRGEPVTEQVCLHREAIRHPEREPLELGRARDGGVPRRWA